MHQHPNRKNNHSKKQAVQAYKIRYSPKAAHSHQKADVTLAGRHHNRSLTLSSNQRGLGRMQARSWDVRRHVTGPYIEIKEGQREFFILGTAHISRESVRDVENAIKYGKPDLVCVELCEPRYQSITDADRWKNLDIVQVIKERKLFLLMSSLILSSFQKKMGEQTEVKPGQEIIRAIELSKRTGTDWALVDRKIQTTLRRAWQGIGFFSKTFLISELAASLLVPPDADEEQIEQMKQKDVLEDLFESLPARYNKIKHILITERDMYLAQKIKEAARQHPKAKRIFGVVGAGHLQGIQGHFQQEVDTHQLDEVKTPSRFWQTVKLLSPFVIFAAAFSLLGGSTDPEKIKQDLLAWAIIKGLFAGVFTLFILPHPLSLVASILAAPFANFNPVIKPGYMAALIEAKFKKPMVEDFERIAEDTETLRGFFKNKVMHIFLSFFIPQFGSLAGTGAFFLFLYLKERGLIVL